MENRFKQVTELLSLKLDRSEFQEKWQEVVKGEMARKDLQIQLNGTNLQVQSAQDQVSSAVVILEQQKWKLESTVDKLDALDRKIQKKENKAGRFLPNKALKEVQGGPGVSSEELASIRQMLEEELNQVEEDIL